VAHILDINKF